MAKKQQTIDVQTIPLNKIIEWPDNPRRTRSDDSVAASAASILAQGQLMPLIVLAVPNSDLFYAIDGETRRKGMNANVDADKAEADMAVKVTVLDPATPQSALLAIAVAANTVREQMNPIEEMEAYHKMALSGMKPRAIGEIFNLSGRQVLQRLALGGLVDGARELVRSGQRQIRWAEAMTVGSPAQQDRIVAEIHANPAAFSDGHSVRAELTRGNIPVESALFDPQELKDCLVSDLFTLDKGGYFSDAEAFWKRQRAEIQKKIDELAATHKDVQFFDRQRFSDAGWATGGEPADSTAVVIAHDDGSVEIREGLIPPAYLNSAGADEDDEGSFLDAAQEAFGSDDAAAPIARIEINPLDAATRPTADYLNAQVAAGLRLKAASDHRVAMAFVIAQTLTRNGGLASSMVISGAGIEVEKQTSEVFLRLAARREAYQRIARTAGILGVTSPSVVVANLLKLDDPALYDVFAWTVSESVTAPLSETTAEVYEAVGLRLLEDWRIEQAYLDDLNSGQIRALAQEVVDIAALPSKNASIPMVKKAIMDAVDATGLQSNWVGATPAWQPPQISRVNDAVANRKSKEDAATASNQAAGANVAAAA